MKKVNNPTPDDLTYFDDVGNQSEEDEFMDAFEMNGEKACEQWADPKRVKKYLAFCAKQREAGEKPCYEA
jgi:hypothetical protein